MISSLIEELLTGDSKEIREITKNEAILVGFLTLVKGIDDLPNISKRFYEESRSLFQVTSSDQSIGELMTILTEFFGKAVKVPGKSLPVTLRFEPTVKYLGGIRKDQTLFLKKLKSGSFYGALWPWQRDSKKVEIHLGFCSPGMNDADYHKLEALTQKFLSKEKIETVSGIGGQIHGISLPSFLQMSEMEGATYTLRVASGDRTGLLFLDGGNLIAAQYEDQSGSEAAYRIISWDNAAIQIEPADADRVREIHEPLMHVMMESLKIKDETGAGSVPPSSDSPAATSSSEPKNEAVPADQPAKGEKKPTRKASIPKTPASTRKTPSRKKRTPPPAPGARQAESTATLAERSAAKQRQMRMTTKVLIVAGAAVFLAAVGVGGGMFFKQRQADHRYEQLLADLEAQQALDARIVRLMQYLKAYPDDVHRAELEQRLSSANIEIEKRDYERTMADVGNLKMDEQYEKKALSLYTAFLSRYPQSSYAESIHADIDAIHQTLAAAYFEQLEAVAKKDLMARYHAYHEYLDRFPQGEKRDAVSGMLADLAEEYYPTIEKEAAESNAQEMWDDGLARCNHFLSLFPRGPAAEKVSALRAELQDKKDLGDLTIKAELAGDDYTKARQIYSDYLSHRPNTTQKKAISERIDALNGELDKKAAWEKTAQYAANPAHDIFSRIQRVEAYADQNASGPYAALARNLRKKLEPDLKAVLREKRLKEQRRRDLARKQDMQARREMERRRIQGLHERVSKQLVSVAERFVDNGDGSVTDRVTGLTWCLLDSYLEVGRCISYKAAKAYVEQLNAGGHTDWRLPTAGELATIYKNPPFFPNSGADWYWTSESFVRGYHRVVDVVTTVPETVFTRLSESEDSCGNIRAVRR